MKLSRKVLLPKPEKDGDKQEGYFRISYADQLRCNWSAHSAFSTMRQLKITKQVTNRETASLDKYLQEIGKVELITLGRSGLAQRIKAGDQIAGKINQGQPSFRFFKSNAKTRA